MASEPGGAITGIFRTTCYSELTMKRVVKKYWMLLQVAAIVAADTAIITDTAIEFGTKMKAKLVAFGGSKADNSFVNKVLILYKQSVIWLLLLLCNVLIIIINYYCSKKFF